MQKKMTTSLFFMLFSMVFSMSFCCPALAQSKGDVQSMLSQFVENGVLSPEQAAQAGQKLNKLSASDWSKIKSRAEEMKASGKFDNQTTSNTLGAASQKIDTNSAQFKQVMEQMKQAIDLGQGQAK